MNKLFYGDNLQVLRENIADESVDLIYLDPPFNSNADYNVLFKSQKGQRSHAQIAAFEDTWHWTEQAEREFSELLSQSNTNVAEVIRALRSFLGENDMMAYLTMMAIRMLELHRVLKETGSLYLHCDSTASHYLKILTDAIFGPENYRNELIWKRRVGMSSAVHEGNRFGICTDIIFFYAKSEDSKFNPQYNLNSPDYQEYIAERFTHVDENGRRFQATSLVNPAHRPNLIYSYKGYEPPPNGWMITKEKMELWDSQGRIYFPKDKEGRLRRKSYADELKGMPVQNLWTDIAEINSQAQERLGYPTQKPLALLERIINASSTPPCQCDVRHLTSTI
jgi:site-specific DNA-methyltransferase (adenine-specific)